MQHGIPGADNRRLGADVARPEARTRAIRCAAIEGNADEGDIQLFGLGNVRQTHEGGNAGEAGVRKGIEGLWMWQAKGAARSCHGWAS